MIRGPALNSSSYSSHHGEDSYQETRHGLGPCEVQPAPNNLYGLSIPMQPSISVDS
jgi:hypothetical protein